MTDPHSFPPSSDHSDDKAHDDAEAAKKARAERMENINNKLHALMWCVLAGMTVYYTDFFRVLLEDPRIDRFYFNIAVVAFGINTCITLYLAVWLPYVAKIHLEWAVYCPRMIPTATVVGLICTLCLILGLWPVWGFLTPAILAVVFIGSLMSAHFLPAL
eukprot:g2296.t1